MKILFFADLHLSEKVSLAGSNPRQYNGQRRSINEARAALAWVAEVADMEQVDAVVFGGDFFDRAKPTPDEYNVAFEALRELSKDRSVFVLVGNHDQTIGAGADATSPLETVGMINVHVISKPDSRVFEAMSGERARFFFLPYPAARPLAESKEAANAEVSRELNLRLSEFAYMANKATNNGDPTANILVAHCTFSGAAYSSGQIAPLTDVAVSTAELGAFDFVAAGHIHKRQRIGLDAAYYIGTLDRWSFGDEGQAVGVLILDVDLDTGAMREEWIDYPQARIFKSVDLEDFEGFVAAIQSSAAAELESKTWLRVVGATADVELYERVEKTLRHLAWSFAGVRNDVVLTRYVDELPVVEDKDDVGALYDAFNAARPEAIPVEDRAAVLSRVEALIQGA